jgi:hypothetical protein
VSANDLNPATRQRRHWLQGAAALACSMALPAPAQTGPAGFEVLLTITGSGVVQPSGPGAPAATQPQTAQFTLPMLAALPQHTITTKLPWHDGERSYSGPLLRDVLAAAKLQAAQARFIALNDYKTDIPLSDATDYPVVLAIRLDGKPMLVRDKGPLFVMYPFDKHPELRQTKYFSRCVWQLLQIRGL